MFKRYEFYDWLFTIVDVFRFTEVFFLLVKVVEEGEILVKVKPVKMILGRIHQFHLKVLKKRQIQKRTRKVFIYFYYVVLGFEKLRKMNCYLAVNKTRCDWLKSQRHQNYVLQRNILLNEYILWSCDRLKEELFLLYCFRLLNILLILYLFSQLKSLNIFKCERKKYQIIE